uniref:Uncharacterized protein n=1 Tax=Nelumbo nucifera TaxID=4432 RepID=A0A822Z058_NELNU|nr:TPA_asm: hypothetical protein HUJ06_007506 [Nelumbo nucifera]
MMGGNLVLVPSPVGLPLDIVPLGVFLLKHRCSIQSVPTPLHSSQWAGISNFKVIVFFFFSIRLGILNGGWFTALGPIPPLRVNLFTRSFLANGQELCLGLPRSGLKPMCSMKSQGLVPLKFIWQRFKSIIDPPFCGRGNLFGK